MVTTYWNHKLLDLSFRGITLTPPARLYFALSTTQPYENGTGVTEPTDSSYSRLEVTCNTTNFSTPANNKTENATVLSFAEATQAWTTPSNPIRYYAIFDSATGGNLLWFGQLTNDKDVVAETILQIPVSGFAFEFTNEE